MKINMQYNIDAIRQNVVAGTQLVFFRKSAFSKFNLGFEQAVWLVCFNLFLALFIDYIKYVPEPRFNHFAISGFSLQIVGLIATAFVVEKSVKTHSMALHFFIQVSSVAPFFYLLAPIIYFQTFYSYSDYIFHGMLIWITAVVGFIVSQQLDRNVKNLLIPITAYGLFVIAPNIWLANGEFWYTEYQEDSRYSEYKNINQENLFDDQFDYLNTINQQLLYHRPNVTDLYFLGFGSYARENVFMKEIHYIQNLMDQKYNTVGRSVALINNLKTMSDTALATTSNLGRVLNMIGQRIDKEEDIVFLYLTSHGSKTPELSVSFWPLKLNQVTPSGLRAALDNAQIKWRIILVSACYSGGFIGPLKNENTLVMTASASDRTSFGCGTKSNFTYFGQAIFKEQLNKNYAFITAFKQAIRSITAREKKENITPSLPQLFIGSQMKKKLHTLENELNIFYERIM